MTTKRRTCSRPPFHRCQLGCIENKLSTFDVVLSDCLQTSEKCTLQTKRNQKVDNMKCFRLLLLQQNWREFKRWKILTSFFVYQITPSHHRVLKHSHDSEARNQRCHECLKKKLTKKNWHLKIVCFDIEHKTNEKKTWREFLIEIARPARVDLLHFS